MKEYIIECVCEDFKLSWPQIIAAQCFVATHGGEYTGAIIQFCPFCGICLQPSVEDRTADLCDCTCHEFYKFIRTCCNRTKNTPST